MSEQKQTFTVPFVITLRGTVDIEAHSEEEARALAAARLSAENISIVQSLRYEGLQEFLRLSTELSREQKIG